VLHIGNDGFYKNRAGVVRVFAAVRKIHVAKLVLAGAPPEQALVELIASLSLRDDVKFVTDPDDATLLQLYRSASVFLFPSLYEGFGWPPLEAMACGCPVVCSTAGSLPEVVGDAALTAAAADEVGLAQHCISLLEDPELARAMAEKGRAWVGSFTLERMRSDLLAAYERALSDG
jgi:glycosyltransferase involved in cell wall biosynthesis